jgi:hypothetical protein
VKEGQSALLTVETEGWRLLIEDGSLPRAYDHYVRNAVFIDHVTSPSREGRDMFIAVARNSVGPGVWPEIVITLKYENSQGVFQPGMLVVPDTSLLFIGAGECLLGYDLTRRQKVFEDWTEHGFLNWSRQGDYVVMSGEVEFGVWTTAGEKLWSTFVEPPWDWRVISECVELDVMGRLTTLRLDNGTPIASL